MKINKIAIVFATLLNAGMAFSCLRADLEDRKPSEVLTKALQFGKDKLESQTTFALWVDSKYLLSGVALDRYTILTCAHGGLQESSSIAVTCMPNFRDAFKAGGITYKVKNHIIHPTYRYEMQIEEKICNERDGSGLSTKGIRFSALETLTFEDFIQTVTQESERYTEFSGHDLAILKLGYPLPDTLPYPDFYSTVNPRTDQLTDADGLSIGYGTLKFNQASGPVPVNEDPRELNYKHLITCKVSAGVINSGTVPVFYGKYKGVLGNGDESFIPEVGMGKMAGLPVDGDSGGPLFIDGKLAGIFSGILAPVNMHIEDAASRAMLTSFVQPVFPVWTDIAAHLD